MANFKFLQTAVIIIL